MSNLSYPGPWWVLFSSSFVVAIIFPWIEVVFIQVCRELGDLCPIFKHALTNRVVFWWLILGSLVHYAFLLLHTLTATHVTAEFICQSSTSRTSLLRYQGRTSTGTRDQFWPDARLAATNRVPTPPGKSWIFFLKIPGSGKSWKITLLLESPGN